MEDVRNIAKKFTGYLFEFDLGEIISKAQDVGVKVYFYNTKAEVRALLEKKSCSEDTFENGFFLGDEKVFVYGDNEKIMFIDNMIHPQHNLIYILKEIGNILLTDEELICQRDFLEFDLSVSTFAYYVLEDLHEREEFLDATKYLAKTLGAHPTGEELSSWGWQSPSDKDKSEKCTRV